MNAEDVDFLLLVVGVALALLAVIACGSTPWMQWVLNQPGM